jgi:MFS family permease
VISAAPNFAHLSSVAWARLAERHHKARLAAAMQTLLVALVASIAFLPVGDAGEALLVAAVVAGRLLIAGLATVRSVVWTQNYPAGARARIASRLSFVSQLGMALAAAGAGLFLDRFEARFGWLYAGAAAIGLVGALAYVRVVVRGEETRDALPIGAASRRAGWRGSRALLREDPLFARYLRWQFLLGVSNMMIEPAVVYAVSRELGAGYGTSIALTTTLPLGLGVLGLPLWAAWVDRVHIATFRARSGWLWVVSQALTGVGALAGSLAGIAVGRVLLGIARGGGSLAWQLGHNDFAHPERAGLYMGVHATLTGLRGFFAPFVGMWLYVGSEAWTLPGTSFVVPAFPAWGGWSMLVASGFAAVATLGFLDLERSIRRSRASECNTGV